MPGTDTLNYLESNPATTATASTLCTHCGADCDRDTVVCGDHVFCCHGCQTVYDLLHQHGLDDYYRLTEAPGIRPDATEDNGRFAFLDDERLAARLLEFASADSARVTFRIPAIHCASCVWLLERLPQFAAGVRRAEADLGRGLLTVIFNPADSTLRQVAETLAALGYEPDLRLQDGREAPITRADRTLIRRLVIAGFCFGNVMLLSIPSYLGMPADSSVAVFFAWASYLLALPALIFSGAGYWQAAWTALTRRAITLDVPIAIGMAALTIESTWEIVTRTGPGYFDSLTGLVFFLLLGRLVQARSYDRLRFDRDYASFFPLAARLREADGATRHVPVDALAIGNEVLLRHGEVMPADGILTSGHAALDYSFVTGEADPVSIAPGERVYAGARQTAGEILVTVDKPVGASYLTSLWSRLPASGSRHELSNLWRVTGGWFTGAVLSIALAAAAWWSASDPILAVRAFAAVMIVACPCALALAAPLGFGFAARALARRGLFLRDGSCVEQLARIRRVVFDKTGTLTTPSNLVLDGATPPADDAARIAAAVAQSAHPVAAMLAAQLPAGTAPASDFREQTGDGIVATIDGHTVRVGRAAWCHLPDAGDGTWATVGDHVYGPWRLANAPRAGIPAMLQRLGASHQLAILTGDHEAGAAAIRQNLPADAEVRCRQQPAAKLAAVNAWEDAGEPVLMVGDGLNDAGALRAGTAGIAVSDDRGGFFPACDGLLDGDSLPRLDALLAFAASTKRVVLANMALSLLYNGIGISLAVSGHLSPLAAAILMPASSLTVLAVSAAGVAIAARKISDQSSGHHIHQLATTN